MKPRFRDKIFFALIVIGLVLVAYSRMSGDDTKEDGSKLRVQIGAAEAVLENPQTLQERTRGLGQIDSIGENEGMVFIFDDPARHVFVMNEMKFSLDFIFVFEDKVVDMAQNVPADFDGKIIGEADYDKVIELNAGWTEKNGVGLGDQVQIMKSETD